MELALVVYFISILPSIEGLFGVLSLACFAAIVGIGIYTSNEHNSYSYTSPERREENKEGRKVALKRVKIFAALAVFCGIIVSAIPSEKQMYAVAGVYAAQKAVESEEFRRLASKSLQAIEMKLDEFITEGKGNAK
jgi:hypothetical protein